MKNKAKELRDKSVEKFEKIIRYLGTGHFQEADLELDSTENCGYCREYGKMMENGFIVKIDCSLCPVTRLPREYFADYSNSFDSPVCSDLALFDDLQMAIYDKDKEWAITAAKELIKFIKTTLYEFSVKEIKEVKCQKRK